MQTFAKAFGMMNVMRCYWETLVAKLQNNGGIISYKLILLPKEKGFFVFFVLECFSLVVYKP